MTLATSSSTSTTSSLAMGINSGWLQLVSVNGDHQSASNLMKSQLEQIRMGMKHMQMLKDTEARLQTSLQTLKQAHEAHCTDWTRQLVELNSQLRKLEDEQYWLQKQSHSIAEDVLNVEHEVEQVKKWPSFQDKLRKQRVKLILVLFLFALLATFALLTLRSLVSNEFQRLSQESFGIYSDL